MLGATRVLAGERFVTLSPHLGELVCAAGACSGLIGTVEHSDWPPQVASLPRVGNAFAVNSEAVLALKPTLVLSWDGGTPIATVDQLRRLGLRVEPIRARTLDDIGAALRHVGTLTHTEQTANVAAKAYEDRIAALRTRYATATPIKVMYQLEAEPMFTINRDSPISEAIKLCGGQNIFADQPRLAGAVSREAVIARDPDVIVFGIQDDVAGIRARWSRVPSVRAVRTGNLIAVDADTLARATPRMVQGVEALCTALDEARVRLTNASSAPAR